MPEKRRHEADRSDNKSRKHWQQDPANQLTPFSVGLFITCVRGKEQIATRDALSMLNDFAERTNLKAEEVSDKGNIDAVEEQLDIDKSIEAEVNALKSRKQSKTALFTAMKTLTECVLFIRTAKSIDPVKLVHDLCTEAQAEPRRNLGGRFLRRMTPISYSADSSLGGLQQCVEKMLIKDFGGRALKYKIEPTFRNHNVLNRDVVIPEVATAISNHGNHTVDLKHYDVIVMVEIMKGYLGIGVAYDWEKLRKFNLMELSSSKSDD